MHFRLPRPPLPHPHTLLQCKNRHSLVHRSLPNAAAAALTFYFLRSKKQTCNHTLVNTIVSVAAILTCNPDYYRAFKTFDNKETAECFQALRWFFWKSDNFIFSIRGAIGTSTVVQSGLEVEKKFMRISYLWNHPWGSSKYFGNNFKIPRGPKSKIYYIKIFVWPFLGKFY